YIVIFFFFQAEDGIRDRNVTGVQTCALPIWVCSTKTVSPTAGSNRPCRADCSPTIWCECSLNSSEARPRAMDRGRASAQPSDRLRSESAQAAHLIQFGVIGIL